MPAKLLVLLATMAGGALAATSIAANSTSSPSASPSVFTPSIAAESFASGTTTISIWYPVSKGSIVGVNNCETTILASEPDQTYTYTQGPSDFQYNFNTFSDGFSFIETSSCSFVSSTIASFSMVALCKETYYGSEGTESAATTVESTTLYPDQFEQFPITVSGDLNQLASGSGACTPTATSTPTSASTSASTSGSMAGSMVGSTPASTSSSTHNAAPTHNAHMAASIGAAALAGLALL